jgi:hypothetical protein
MACARPGCGCREADSTRNGGSYCGEDCANHAEESARDHSQPVVAEARERREGGCGCGQEGCAG